MTPFFPIKRLVEFS